jgi:predicted NBD/HSP70 family sugar kinase
MRKVNQKRTRVHTTQLVLKTIYSNRPISRADVARITNLTPPTVSDIVANLVDIGLVEEVGHAPSSSGRRAILLQVVDNSRQLIGIDLSRQDFRGALANLRGKINHRVNLPLNGRDGEEALGLVYDLVDTLIKSASNPLLGIGIGAPGLVDASDGILQQSVNLNWRYIPMRNLLQERYSLPVYMANDCQVATLAEYTFGNKVENSVPLVVINMGWGVGAGIIVSGQLLHGTPVGAGEIGHVTVAEDGLQCACGNYGCLETIASSQAIIKRIQALFEKNTNSYLNKLVTNPSQISSDTVIQALENGNEEVQQIIYEAGKALGIAASNLVGILGNCRILIHSKIAHANPLMLDAIREELTKRTLPSLARASEVGVTSVGSDIVILGASALVLQHELGVL